MIKLNDNTYLNPSDVIYIVCISGQWYAITTSTKLAISNEVAIELQSYEPGGGGSSNHLYLHKIDIQGSALMENFFYDGYLLVYDANPNSYGNDFNAFAEMWYTIKRFLNIHGRFRNRSQTVYYAFNQGSIILEDNKYKLSISYIDDEHALQVGTKGRPIVFKDEVIQIF